MLHIKRIYVCYTSKYKKPHASSLTLNCYKIDSLLKWMATGDDTWVNYDNVKRKRP